MRRPSQPSRRSSALSNRYCASCHNEKAKQGNFVLSTLDVANVGTDAERWELVVRKLRARSMPPAGRPRPDEAAYDALIAHLETSLDRVAAANPDPGRTDTFRRLNRTEYQNAIRDLLDVEIDVETLLPSDDSSHGFDNISVGGLSPMLLERYLSAAQKISRLAVGTPVRSAGAETVVLPADLTQEDHFDGQPFGTRAGTSVRYTFPADGEYQFELRLTRDRNELIEGLTEPHQMEVSIDGVRQQVFTLKPAPRSGPVDTVAPQYAAGAGGRRASQLPRRASPADRMSSRWRFIKRPSALVETERQPYLASFNSDRTPRTQPALYSVSIAGPFNPSGIGETPSRQRIFTCRPAKARATKRRARKTSSRRWRAARIGAPPRATRCRRCSASTSRVAPTAASSTASRWRLRAMLTSPAFLFRIEREPLRAEARYGGQARYRRIASAISNSPRGCRSSSGAAFPTTQLLDAAVQGTPEGCRACSSSRCAGCWPTRAQTRWSTTSPRSGCTCAISTAASPTTGCFPISTTTSARRSGARPSCCSRASLKEDRSVLDLLRADYTFLNERLAKHYGIPNVYGSHFRRVELGQGSRARRAARPGQHHDGDVVREPHVAGAPRQVDSRESARHARAAAAAERAAAARERIRVRKS